MTLKTHPKNIELIRAVLDGAVLQINYSDVWTDEKRANIVAYSLKEAMLSEDPVDHMRIKPATIRIGEIDVPAPITEEPLFGDNVFFPCKENEWAYALISWNGCPFHLTMLKRRQLHLTAEDAIAHAKAEIIAAGGSCD